MLTLDIRCYVLPLKWPFTISRYTVRSQQTVIVSISDGMHTGYGEATANPYYHSTRKKIISSIESVRELVEGSADLEPSDLWSKMEPQLKNDYFALCALDCAFWDLYARKRKRPLRSFFTDSYGTPLSNYTIGIDDIAVMRKKITEKPWPIYKIKLGTEKDIEILSELRKLTDSTFRVDANCSWTVSQTLDFTPSLIKLGVEFIEQPLPAVDMEGMRTLRERCEIPLIADESCQRMKDLDPCSQVFDGINIKLMKCGGLTPAFRMIKKARKKGLMVMAGCMTESTIGISNLVQIAPILDSIDADGAMLLKNDIASGVELIDGRIKFSSLTGSGTTLL